MEVFQRVELCVEGFERVVGCEGVEFFMERARRVAFYLLKPLRLLLETVDESRDLVVSSEAVTDLHILDR